MSGNLHALPKELLVQHILTRLDLPTLRSCSSACRRLNLTIKSSAQIKYLIKLQEMSVVDNPAVSYHEIPLARRLEMLKEYEERLAIRWKASAAVLPRQLSRPRSIKREANVLYTLPDSVVEAQELHWTTLPSKEDQAIKWDIFRPSNPSVNIAALALSIEENDLFAFATWEEAGNMFPIQIHLMQHSTRFPYPGLASSIINIRGFRSFMGDHPFVKLAIRRTNLAVMVGHESLQLVMDRNPDTWMGHLSVWNWKTGEMKCEKDGIPDKDMDLVFLREDILLHGGNYDLPMIECLGLPRLKDELYDPFPEFNLDISFADNPTAVPSFVESFNPTVPRLFTAKDLSSILTIKMMFEEDESCTSYLFITHLQTLLGRAESALSHGKRGQDATALVKWEEWGPDVTRMFWHDHDLYRPLLDAPCGLRLFIRGQSNNRIEVYDFGRVTAVPIQSPQEREIETASPLRWIVQGGGPGCHRAHQIAFRTPDPRGDNRWGLGHNAC